jgi:hypothetical protein
VAPRLGLGFRQQLGQFGDISRNPPRLILAEQFRGRASTRLSIGLRHTIGAAAKYSQFCLFEGGQLLRVSGDCEGPHAGSHSENLSASRNFDARGSYALRGCQRNLYILVRRLTWCVAFNAVLTWLRLCGPSIGATTTRVTFGIARNAAPVFRVRPHPLRRISRHQSRSTIKQTRRCGRRSAAKLLSKDEARRNNFVRPRSRY